MAASFIVDNDRKMNELLDAMVVDNPTIPLLVLEGYVRIENFCSEEKFRDILRKWRHYYSFRYYTPHVAVVLKSLKCFQAMDVPLFFDDQSIKLSLSDYKDHIEKIHIGLESRVSLLGCDDEDEFPYKNIMRGHWYTVVDNSSNAPDSGDEEIKTLHELGVRGLWQGEIIYNPTKNVVIVILYAARNVDREKSFTGLMKPTLDVVRQNFGENTQITFSIVVPKYSAESELNFSMNLYDGQFWELNDQERCTLRETNSDNDFSNDSLVQAVNLLDTSDQMVRTENLDLLQAFSTFKGYHSFLRKLVENLEEIKNPDTTLFALEGLFELESDVSSKIKVHPFSKKENEYPLIEELRSFLKKWRYHWRSSFYFPMPENLKIFKFLQVPLFTDNFGTVHFLYSFNKENLDTIDISEDTPVIHVTHQRQAESITEDRNIKPSDNKNIIAGTWFGVGNISESVYGSFGFKTTLKKLGIKGLEQGEIVYYKNERNVILYATDGVHATFTGLKKPKPEITDKLHNTYVRISIFVPARFLPSENEFNYVFEIDQIYHGPFCVTQKRNFDRKECPELGWIQSL